MLLIKNEEVWKEKKDDYMYLGLAVQRCDGLAGGRRVFRVELPTLSYLYILSN